MSFKKLYPILVATVACTAPQAFGWGLVAPNGPNANQYYQVIDKKLMRFDCPDGEVPTGTSCDDSQVPLGTYDIPRDDKPRPFNSTDIRLSLVNELNGILAKLAVDISNETTKLKEADPKTVTLRQEIRASAAKSDALQVASLKTDQRINASRSNLALIAAELKLVDEGLRKDPTEAELKRLLERQRRYASLNTQFTTQLAELEKEQSVNKAERGTLAQSILATNQALDTHLASLKVTSPELAQLELSNAAYTRESKLVADLDARLDAKLAYELSEWKEPGAPELFARLLKHVRLCAAK